MAQLIATPVEALTIVVLVHELAHAFTHVGADIDGHRWLTSKFHEAEPDLVEGLAQYYAALVCNRLERQNSEASDAYKKLMPHQPAHYRVQEKWLKTFTPEEVRLAMIETRRKGIGKVGDFETLLCLARQRLRRQGEE